MMGLREEAFDLCKTRIVERFRNDIEALILVGSFARGEEIVRHVGGKEVFVSDMEFLAVTKKDGMRKELQIDIEGVDVSIGKTTATALKDAGFANVRVAKEANDSAMAHSLLCLSG